MILRSLPFILAIAAWLASVRPFWARATFFFDAKMDLAYLNYFLNSIQNGVFPLWDPFNYWGRPQGFVGRVVGEHNPFYLLILLLQKLGVAYPQAFALFFCAYFVSGICAFYLLARIVLKDRRAAYLAFVVLLFSTLGHNIFNDILIIMMMVPGLWFFFFLFAFLRTGAVRFFLGLALSGAILAMTYLPFFFLTVFLCFLIFYCCLYMKTLPVVARQVLGFCRERAPAAWGGAAILLAGILPGLNWWLIVKKGEFIVNWRSESFASKGIFQLNLAEINNGAHLFAYHSVAQLFSYLRDIQIQSLYVPVLGLLVLLLGAGVRVTRTMILLSATTVTLFLISVANAAGLHAFLFKHVFYFQHFRNLHYLFWFCVPLGVLLAAEIFRQFMRQLVRGKDRRLSLAWVLGVHGAAILFLFFFQEQVVGPVYAAVMLSALLFSLVVLGKMRARGWGFSMFLLAIVLVESWPVFSYLTRNHRADIEQYVLPPLTTQTSRQFAFTRPVLGSPWDSLDVEGFGAFTDSSGFELFGNRFSGSKWAYALLKTYAPEDIKDYVRHKFMLYDGVVVGVRDPGGALKDVLAGRCNKAVADSGTADDAPQVQVFSCEGKPVSVDGNSSAFHVLKFDDNRIMFRTNFATDKYLVYNDSYDSAWKASMNGRTVRVQRANGAFKGIFLPAGENVVRLEYGGWWQRIFLYWLEWGLAGFTLFLIGLFIQAGLQGRRRCDRGRAA